MPPLVSDIPYPESAGGTGLRFLLTFRYLYGKQQVALRKLPVAQPSRDRPLHSGPGRQSFSPSATCFLDSSRKAAYQDSRNERSLRHPELSSLEPLGGRSLAADPDGRKGSLHHQYQYSNRHTYEKLEVELTHLFSARASVLIDTKTHFIQGKNAQFWCTSISTEGGREPYVADTEH